MDTMRTLADELRARHGVAISTVFFDAADRASHAALATSLKDAETPNVLLAFAIMLERQIFEPDPAAAANLLDVNLSASTSVLMHLLPVVEARPGARVVIVGSVAGDRGRPRNYVYGASKAGLHALASGLRARLHKAGVSVTLVKPGPFRSPMTGDRKGLGPLPSPESIAATTWKAAMARRSTVYAPWHWRWIMLVVRLLPEPLFKRLDF